MLTWTSEILDLCEESNGTELRTSIRVWTKTSSTPVVQPPNHGAVQIHTPKACTAQPHLVTPEMLEIPRRPGYQGSHFRFQTVLSPTHSSTLLSPTAGLKAENQAADETDPDRDSCFFTFCCA